MSSQISRDNSRSCLNPNGSTSTENYDNAQSEVEVDSFPLSSRISRNNSSSSLNPNSSTSTENHDNAQGEVEVDSLPKKLEFHWYDSCIMIYSVVTYILDTGFDIAVAYSLYTNRKMWYFGLTVAFIVIPTLTMTFFSLRWYIADSKLPGSPKPTRTIWTIRVILLLLQLGPALRYLDSLKFGIKFKNAKEESEKIKYYKWMSYEDADAGLLRLFEAFMEAAPQLLLQIYILAGPDQDQDHFTVMTQVGSSIVSLLSMSWALASQQRSMRVSLASAKNPSWPATIVQALWYVFVTGSRMLTLGLFASIFPIHLAIICAVRWLIMTTWLQFLKSNFCTNKIEEFLYRCVLGVVFLFCYFNPVDSPTRWRYFFYYLYTFTENSILIAVWYNWVDPDLWYRLPAMFAIFLSFFVGILFMVVYYLMLHPSGAIEIYGWCSSSTKDKKGQEDRTATPETQELTRSNGYCPSPLRELQVNFIQQAVNEKDEEQTLEPMYITRSNGTLPRETSLDEDPDRHMREILAEVYPDRLIGTPV